MIEHGLSVSLSPRTPMGQSSPMGDDGYPDAPRKYIMFGESVSPRVDVAVVAARCLDFSSPLLDNTELSPVSFASASASASATTVGDCGVCYTVLPERSNHVYTLCGHLFCVRCLLKWWDTNTTCPICRAELFEKDTADEAAAVAAAASAAATVDDSDEWMIPPPIIRAFNIYEVTSDSDDDGPDGVWNDGGGWNYE